MKPHLEKFLYYTCVCTALPQLTDNSHSSEVFAKNPTYALVLYILEESVLVRPGINFRSG